MKKIWQKIKKVLGYIAAFIVTLCGGILVICVFFVNSRNKINEKQEAIDEGKSFASDDDVNNSYNNWKRKRKSN